MPTQLICPTCKVSVPLDEFLSACSDYWDPLALVKFTCPNCAKSTDAQIANGCVSLGYVYGAGAPHFCGMIDVEVADLSTEQDGSGLIVEHEDRTWTIGKKNTHR